MLQKPENRDEYRDEVYYSRISRKHLCEWNYRDANGELHTGVAPDRVTAKARAAKFGFQNKGDAESEQHMSDCGSIR
jgi:hypothetical protein